MAQNGGLVFAPIVFPDMSAYLYPTSSSSAVNVASNFSIEYAREYAALTRDLYTRKEMEKRQPGPNLAWLDKRVDEMRVRL